MNKQYYCQKTLSPIRDNISRLTETSFQKRGFSEKALIFHWNALIPEKWQGYTFPEKITWSNTPHCGGILHIALLNNSLAPLLQHEFPVVIERINTYFGYKAIIQLKIHHRIKSSAFNRFSSQSENIRNIQISKLKQDKLNFILLSIQHESLKEKIYELGKMIFYNIPEK